MFSNQDARQIIMFFYIHLAIYTLLFSHTYLNPSLLLSLDSLLLSPVVNCIVFIVFCSFSSSIPCTHCTVQCVLLVLHNKEYTYLLTFLAMVWHCLIGLAPTYLTELCRPQCQYSEHMLPLLS